MICIQRYESSNSLRHYSKIFLNETGFGVAQVTYQVSYFTKMLTVSIDDVSLADEEV